MERILIQGDVSLKGEVKVSGAKNAAVAILPAALLIDGSCVIENVPDIKDIHILKNIMKDLGAKITYDENNEIHFNCKDINSFEAISEDVSKLRASYYFLGAMLGRFKKAKIIFLEDVILEQDQSISI